MLKGRQPLPLSPRRGMSVAPSYILRTRVWRQVRFFGVMAWPNGLRGLVVTPQSVLGRGNADIVGNRPTLGHFFPNSSSSLLS